MRIDSIPQELLHKLELATALARRAELEYEEELLTRTNKAIYLVKQDMTLDQDRYLKLKADVEDIENQISDIRVAAIASKKLKFPLGSKLSHKSKRWVKGKGYTEVKDTGTLELVTRFTVFSGNSYYNPEPGTLIVRFIRKDGTPGVTWWSYFPNEWELAP